MPFLSMMLQQFYMSRMRARKVRLVRIYGGLLDSDGLEHEGGSRRSFPLREILLKSA